MPSTLGPPQVPLGAGDVSGRRGVVTPRQPGAAGNLKGSAPANDERGAKDDSELATLCRLPIQGPRQDSLRVDPGRFAQRNLHHGPTILTSAVEAPPCPWAARG